METCMNIFKSFTSIEAIKEKPVDNANKVEAKFEVGDFIVYDYCMGRIVEITNDAYLLDTKQGIPFSCHSTRLWDITKDAKDGDLIYVGTEEKGIQAIFHEHKNGTIFFYCYLCGDFAQGGYMPIGSVEFAYPLQKIHYNRFFEKMKEAGYEWDAEKKELKKIDQKPSWSEEDERTLQGIWDEILANKHNAKEYDWKTYDKFLDWLKSLKKRINN